MMIVDEITLSGLIGLFLISMGMNVFLFLKLNKKKGTPKYTGDNAE